MKISIALASYNGEEFIEAQLLSFSKQSRLPDELIVVDDGSTDGTEQIVRNFALSSPFPVQFFRNTTKLGYCGNFNTALSKTSGDLVFLSDQDDYWMPNKIGYIEELAKKFPAALMIMNDAELTDKNLSPLGFTKQTQLSSAGFPLSDFVMGCCSAVRRELLDIALPVPEGFHAHDLWLSVISEALNAKLIDRKILQLYRRHDNNESTFVANSTRKISRASAYIRKLSEISDRDSAHQSRANLDQLCIMHNGIRSLNQKTPAPYTAKLMILESRLEQKIDFERLRIELRDKHFIKRLAATTLLWLKGRYSSASGVKSFLRDLLG